MGEVPSGAGPTRVPIDKPNVTTPPQGTNPTICLPDTPPATQPSSQPVARSLFEFGRYQVLEELGSGGVGVVYRAHDRTLGRDVALKVLHVAGRVEAETIERFQREARASAQLDHPNIIRVHDVGTLPNGSPYYTMELLAGVDLSHAIVDGLLGPKEFVEVLRQVALALFYAHQQGIVHRDIKPQNIFVRLAPAAGPRLGPAALREVHALVLDFGLAKLVERDLASHAESSEGRRSMQSLTRNGEIFGTPAYMPPEQTLGAKGVDARADIYSLGAALYHALAGRPPFEAPSLAELLEKVRSEDPPPPSAFNADVDDDLDTVCLKCLQKEPYDRYQTAGELAEDLRLWLAGDSIRARPISFVGRVWRRAKRNKAVALSLTSLALGAVALTLFFGGGAVVRRARLAGYEREASRALQERRFEEAEAPARKAVELAPAERRYADLLAQALSGRAATEGDRLIDEYRRLRARIADLEAAEKQAEEKEKSAPPEQRLDARAARWRIEDERRTAEAGRADAWPKAVVKFTEAVTLWKEQPDARTGLTELYWDRYLQGERDRDRIAQATYGPLVAQFGGAAFESMVRCEREVHVSFLLPQGFAADHVEMYLFEYRHKKAPPIEFPVPLAADNTVADAAPELADDPSLGLSVPLRQAQGEKAADARAGSAYALRLVTENHVQVPVRKDASSGRRVADLRRSLPKGSYLLYLPPGQGLYEMRYPFVVARDIGWDETCEVPDEDDAPRLPPGRGPSETGERRSYWVYIAPGAYRASGDPNAMQTPRRDAAVVRVPEKGAQGYYLARYEVSSPMYLAYLNDREWHQACVPPCGDWGHVPRKAAEAMQQTAYWTREGGRFKLAAGWEGLSVMAISWNDAVDYCQWLTQRVGRGEWTFGLPDEDEWEKAARGPDGRSYPWGDEFESGFCAMVDSRPGETASRAPEPFGLFPLDEGPYGVRDLAGCANEWTKTESGGGAWRIVKGGSWGSGQALCRAASRFVNAPGLVVLGNGIRVAAHRTIGK